MATLDTKKLSDWSEPEDKTEITSKIKRYVLLKKSIKEMEIELKQLADSVASEIAVEYNGKYEAGFGKFQVQTRKKWQYSDVVDQFVEEVKKQKKVEELNGTAKVIGENQILVFTAAKS